MKKLAFLGAATGLGVAILASQTGHAADHLDSPTLLGNPLGDINDVYAWMTNDGAKVNLAMTVSPGDDGSRHFGPAVQYVWHVTTKPMLGVGMHGTEIRVICSFASDTSAQCWVGNIDYVTGDPSNSAGITSLDGKVRLFAGTRSDPFFFNLQGFRKLTTDIENAAAGLSFDAAGCPVLPTANAAELRADLSGVVAAAAPPCPAARADCFDGLNVKAIVIQIDKTLLNANGNKVLSVWGSTHMGS